MITRRLMIAVCVLQVALLVVAACILQFSEGFDGFAAIYPLGGAILLTPIVVLLYLNARAKHEPLPSFTRQIAVLCIIALAIAFVRFVVMSYWLHLV